MQPTVYLETSIISYLAARPSRDLIVTARQQLTQSWWRERRPGFDLYVSQLVLDEARAGDRDVAERRVALLAGLPVLDITPEVAELAAALVERVPLPPRAGADATHIAVAAYHGMDFLVTWNSAHIANAELRERVEQVCRESGCAPRSVHAGRTDGRQQWLTSSTSRSHGAIRLLRRCGAFVTHSLPRPVTTSASSADAFVRSKLALGTPWSRTRAARHPAGPATQREWDTTPEWPADSALEPTAPVAHERPGSARGR